MIESRTEMSHKCIATEEVYNRNLFSSSTLIIILYVFLKINKCLDNLKLKVSHRPKISQKVEKNPMNKYTVWD